MSRDIVSIDCHECIAAAQERMKALGVRHLVVTDREAIVGILSERDVFRLEASKHVDPEVMAVGQAMTPDPVTVSIDARADVVAESMAWRHATAVIVADRGQPVGLFTTTDALRALARVLRPVDFGEKSPDVLL